MKFGGIFVKKSIIKFFLFSLLLSVAFTILLDKPETEDPPYQGSRTVIEYII